MIQSRSGSLTRLLRKRFYVISAFGLLILCSCWSLGGHFILPPVSSSSLCGAWRASNGSLINISGNGEFVAADVPFDESTVSGHGSWEFGQGASIEGILTLRFREARTSLEVRTRRNWVGDLRLLVSDFSGGDEELQYLKEDGC